MKQAFFLFVNFVFISVVINAQENKVFPGVVPSEKPNQELSAAMHRMYDRWNPHEDRDNELYSNFK